MNTKQLLASAEWIWNLADRGAAWDRLKEAGDANDIAIAQFLEDQGMIRTVREHWFERASITGKQDVLSQWNERRRRAGLKMGRTHMLAEFSRFCGDATEKTVNGQRVLSAKVFEEGEFYRWQISTAGGLEYVDGGNYRRREDAIHGLKDALDSL